MHSNKQTARLLGRVPDKGGASILQRSPLPTLTKMPLKGSAYVQIFCNAQGFSWYVLSQLAVGQQKRLARLASSRDDSADAADENQQGGIHEHAEVEVPHGDATGPVTVELGSSLPDPLPEESPDKGAKHIIPNLDQSVSWTTQELSLSRIDFPGSTEALTAPSPDMTGFAFVSLGLHHLIFDTLPRLTCRDRIIVVVNMAKTERPSVAQDRLH